MSRENRDKEFNELSAQALRCLETPQEVPPTDTIRRLRPVYRFWHYPSFGLHRSWLVLLLRNEKNSEFAMARQVCWDRPSDYERLFNPMEGLKKGFSITPTIDVREGVIKLDEFYEQLILLKKVSIPIGGFPEAIGVDGERFGFESFNFIGSARLEWWCEGPSAWKEFIRWYDDMRESLESRIRTWE